jgi:hypothetical protein
MFIEGTQRERPLTHELIANILRALGNEDRKGNRQRSKSGTYFTRLVLSAENELQQKKIIDARPSDCLPMAAQQCAPIYVSLDVWLHETDVSSPRGRGVDPTITASASSG